MLYHALLAGLGLAGLAAAAPVKTKATDQGSGAQNVVYWGADGQNKNLSDYCTPSAGIDILVLSFLNNWGISGDIPSGIFGGTCIVNPDGSFASPCSDLASQIKTCQSAGVKIIISLGGATGNYSLLSQAQAETTGQYLWDAYGKSGNTTVQRPFGEVVVDGWDFDLEQSKSYDTKGSQWYQYLVSTLRSNFAKDTSKRYYISGAPQCPSPDVSVGDAIQNSVFDYIFIQFYNNNPRCSLGVGSNAPINWDEWTNLVSSSKSSSAKIFVGAPAGRLGANSAESGAVYYASPSQLAPIVNRLKSDSYFGGVMLWDASWSDQNVIAGCTFAQQTKSILTTGATCQGTPDDSGSPPAPPATSSVTYSPPASTSVAYSPPASTSPASSLPVNSSSHTSGSSGNGGGSVAQWGQVR